MARDDKARPDTFRRRVWPIYLAVVLVGVVVGSVVPGPLGEVVLLIGFVIGVVGIGREVAVGYRTKE